MSFRVNFHPLHPDAAVLLCPRKDISLSLVSHTGSTRENSPLLFKKLVPLATPCIGCHIYKIHKWMINKINIFFCHPLLNPRIRIHPFEIVHADKVKIILVCTFTPFALLVPLVLWNISIGFFDPLKQPRVI